MKPEQTAVIELRDLELKTDIGAYGPQDTRPDVHILDLTLGVRLKLDAIATDALRSALVKR
jgi:dihydroneopterin aldolase